MPKRDTVATETVVLTGAQFTCTGCGKTKNASEFGLRNMPDGKVRNQPQCKSCRGMYRF